MTEMPESSMVAVPPLTLGWRLQMAMSKAGMSRPGMADALGVSIATITRWTSDRGTPKKAFLVQWAWLTRVPVDWLETGLAPSGSPDKDRMTTSGYLGDPVAFPTFGVNSDTPSSHALPWQLVTPACAVSGSVDYWQATQDDNDERQDQVRVTAQHALSAADIRTGSKVAA